MGAIVSKKNTDYVNNNWNELKCSPIGPLLQMIGIAPGNSNDTSQQCKSSEFSSQFNSSMTEHINMTSNLNKGVNAITGTINGIRTAIASMEQRAFQDLSSIATQIFSIYVKIGNIFYIIIKNLINIMNIFKQSINFGASIARLLIAFIDLLEIPVNALISIITFFTRG
jgi:hypothetical protein